MISARKDSAVTQQQLADRLSKPQSYVSKYERGERRIDVVEFLQIAEVLEFDPCLMFKEITRDVTGEKKSR